MELMTIKQCLPFLKTCVRNSKKKASTPFASQREMIFYLFLISQWDDEQT